jgi:hypothetical protein
MITRRGVMNKTEAYKGFTISWQEPPQTGAKWTANVGSEDRHLFILMGKVVVIDGGTRGEMIAEAKKYIDKLFG